MKQNVVAILGAGRIARVHAEALSRYRPDIRIKYVADPYLTEESQQWATQIGVEQICKDAECVFADTEVTCVFICSPTPTHCSYILRACETGKHVYCEKPLDSDIGKIYQAIEAIDRSGIKFLMGFMRRFDKNQQKLQQTIARGQIGTPQIIKLCSRDPALPPYPYIATSGGIYFDSMIHDFDLARFFSGSEVSEVYACGNALIDPHVADYGDIDTALAVLKFESGAVGLIDLSRQSNCGYDQRTEVHGSSGFAQVANVPETTVSIHNEQGVHTDKPVYFFLERYADAFVHAQAAFFDMVNHNATPPVTAYDGLQAVRIARAAQLSLQENRPVRLAEIP
jgi:myo-inositol 2-dehydrogenase/D-chiro-inositol 1-dehydrogenase